MAIVAGNFVCKTSFGIQGRVFLINWMEKSSGRSYCSSFPVRYTPKKSSKTGEARTKSTPTKITDKKVINKEFEVSNGDKGLKSSFVLDKKLQNQNQGPIHNLPTNAYQGAKEEIHYDEGGVEYEYVEEPEEVVEELGIHQGKDLRKSKQDAEKLAIELLATRAYTTVELRKKLNGKKFPLHIIDAVIMDFQTRGLINDCLYAETFSRSRWSSSSWGPRRIKQALFKKGVSEVDAEKAVKLVFEDTNSSGDQELSHGLSKVSMDHLFVQTSKQWLRGQDVTNETRKSRIIRWLQYRGFNWGVISLILKKLESKYSP